jgi:uncharacterized iron-regulated membrane protein
MADVARQHHLHLGEELGISYQPELGVYDYAVRSSADRRWDNWNTGLWLDGDTGDQQSISLPTGDRTGDAIDNLLLALHYAELRGILIYRIFDCAFGVVLGGIAGTGVYIWRRKRTARNLRLRKNISGSGKLIETADSRS